MAVTDVILDFCGVVFDWQPRACLDRAGYPADLVDRICSPGDDAGFYYFEDRLDQGDDTYRVVRDYEAEYGPELAAVFRYYIDHYADALPRVMPGMEDLMEDLHRAGLGVWGLTNWGYETFPQTFAKFPRIRRLLNGTVVSGVEKVFKPGPEIYELALDRFGLAADRCAFFDDTERNVAGAEAVGIHAFRFRDADTARADLASLGVAL